MREYNITDSMLEELNIFAPISLEEGVKSSVRQGFDAQKHATELMNHETWYKNHYSYGVKAAQKRHDKGTYDPELGKKAGYNLSKLGDSRLGTKLNAAEHRAVGEHIAKHIEDDIGYEGKHVKEDVHTFEDSLKEVELFKQIPVMEAARSSVRSGFSPEKHATELMNHETWYKNHYSYGVKAAQKRQNKGTYDPELGKKAGFNLSKLGDYHMKSKLNAAEHRAVGEHIAKHIEDDIGYKHSVKESVEPFKVGTKVKVDGKLGEINHVRQDHSGSGDHKYKVTDLGANDPYKQTRLRGNTFISHSNVTPVNEAAKLAGAEVSGAADNTKNFAKKGTGETACAKETNAVAKDTNKAKATFKEEVELEEGKIDPVEAKEILTKHDALGKDFHALSSSQVDGLLASAKAKKYRKSASAPGSTARMFHQHLTRLVKEEVELDEGIDNGPKGRVKTDNIKYGQTRSMTGGTASKSELAGIKREVSAHKAAQTAAKKAVHDKYYGGPAKSKKIDTSDPKLHKALGKQLGGKFEHFESEPRHAHNTEGHATMTAHVTHSYTHEDLGMHPDDMPDTAETYKVHITKHPKEGYKIRHMASGLHEETEQLDEISGATLGSYIQKARAENSKKYAKGRELDADEKVKDLNSKIKGYYDSKQYTSRGESKHKKAIEKAREQIDARKKKLDPNYPESVIPKRHRGIEKAINKLHYGKMSEESNIVEGSDEDFYARKAEAGNARRKAENERAEAARKKTTVHVGNYGKKPVIDHEHEHPAGAPEKHPKHVASPELLKAFGLTVRTAPAKSSAPVRPKGKAATPEAMKAYRAALRKTVKEEVIGEQLDLELQGQALMIEGTLAQISETAEFELTIVKEGMTYYYDLSIDDETIKEGICVTEMGAISEAARFLEANIVDISEDADRFDRIKEVARQYIK